MARRRGTANMFQPVRGLVTEFTPTRFPAEACIDCDNVIFEKDGSVRRRGGVNFEQEFVERLLDGEELTELEVMDWAIKVDSWESVANSGTLDIAVVQLGTWLQFYAKIGSVSANYLGEVNLLQHCVNVQKQARTPLEMDSGIGNLYVTGTYMNPVQISYDGDTFTVVQLQFEERDYDGVDDGLEVAERPTTLTVHHYYNLLNQGWTDENIRIFAGQESLGDLRNIIAIDNPIEAASGKDWPSNADLMYLGFTTDDDGNPVFERDAIVEEHQLGNTPAPKGHFILDPFFRDRVAAMGTAGVGVEITPTRPEQIAFHNGKIFFTRPVVRGKPNGIYFSRTLVQEQYVRFLRPENDPTADEVNDLLATDGGFVPTPAVGQIYVLRELGNGILVGASNGIWFLTGADIDSGFSATSHRLIRVSKTGMLSASSYVEGENSAYFFGVDGVIGITISESGLPAAANLSKGTVQSLYVNISAESRRHARGIFIPEQNKVYWGYRGALAASKDGADGMDRFLILDLTMGAFYPYSIATLTDVPLIHDLTSVKPLADAVGEDALLESGGDDVTLQDGTPVNIASRGRNAQVATLKLLTILPKGSGGWRVSFAGFEDRSFHDWRFYEATGVGYNYTSFLEFGYNTFGTQHTKGKPTFIHSFFAKRSKNLDPGGYYELPPAFFFRAGMRVSQSVLEVLSKPAPNMRVSQSVTEILVKPLPKLRASQSVQEILIGV